LDQFLNTKVLQGSVSTRLRCDGIFNDQFITESLMSLKVREFWKSINICRSCGQLSTGSFFMKRDVCTGRHKSSPVKNVCYSLTSTESSYIKFYTLLTHSLSCKSDKFYCIIYRIDKNASFSHGTICQFWHYQKLSHLIAFNIAQTSQYCKHFFSYSKCPNVIHEPSHTLSTSD